jgi:ribosomal protein S18 acetylase RimI-like enzyme
MIDTAEGRPSIERLKPPVSEADLHSLAGLLLDAVESGAAVSFLSLTLVQAEDWWRRQLAAPCGAIFLVARDVEGIVGCVQAQPSWAPNQPHHAGVSKLLVHRRGRRQGLGERLMQALEAEAQAAGLTLLTLDSRRGDAGERLYRRLGWTVVGTIPRYALDTDGRTLHDTVVFFKELRNLPG